MDALKGHFTDELTFDAESKTAISFRDGVLTYLGAELGLEPADKEFTVYRSPATIANASTMMQGVPLTDEHVPLDEPPANPVGSVEHAELIDLFSDETASTVGVKNRITITDMIKGALSTGKRQLSLGYGADLVPHSKYDFEQKSIQPHHLAVVQAGRCGSACSFIDHKQKEGAEMATKPKGGQPAKKPDTGQGAELNAVFTDQEGQPSLEQIVEIAQELPEALRKLPMDKLQEVMPSLQEVVALAKGQMGEADMGAEDMDKDEDYEDGNKEQMDVTDSQEFADAVKRAVDSAVKTHNVVVDKARNFVDEGYSFIGKTTEQVMRDALAANGYDAKSFADAELSTAFKMLKPAPSNTRNFGDGAPDEPGRFSKHFADKEG